MSAFILYLLIGLLLSVYVLGKDIEQFRSRGDGSPVVLFNFLISIVIWPIWVVPFVGAAVDAEKNDRESK